MNAALFYAVGTAAALLAIAVEAILSRRAGKRWYVAADTIGNLNLAAGNLVLGVVLAGFVYAGYAAVYSLRVADASSVLPAGASLAAAIVFSDFLQYWNHRLSHRVNLLWWGHITHHSSAQLNLSTGIRINWLYRSYAWLLYAPMPLLGFSFEEFIASQIVINVFNLFLHTRYDVPFGPLAKVLVSPAAHRLHHAADPRYFGNYGAALIVWDRLFGTYRELPEEAKDDVVFGIGRNVDSVDPIDLNFHYLRELWTTARARRCSFFGLLFGTAPGLSAQSAPVTSPREISPFSWLGLLFVAGVALAVSQRAPLAASGAKMLAVAAGLGLVIAFGALLETRRRGREAP